MEKSGNSRLAQTSRVCGIISLNNDVMYTTCPEVLSVYIN